jgi:hypothetical protein
VRFREDKLDPACAIVGPACRYVGNAPVPENCSLTGDIAQRFRSGNQSPIGPDRP